jgi:hypothetical protein
MLTTQQSIGLPHFLASMITSSLMDQTIDQVWLAKKLRTSVFLLSHQPTWVLIDRFDYSLTIDK